VQESSSAPPDMSGGRCYLTTNVPGEGRCGHHMECRLYPAKKVSVRARQAVDVMLLKPRSPLWPTMPVVEVLRTTGMFIVLQRINSVVPVRCVCLPAKHIMKLRVNIARTGLFHREWHR